MRALWAPGTKAYAGDARRLPETTSYPRPAHDIPVIVGGTGERRTLGIAARLGDACNLPVDADVLDRAAVLDGTGAVGRTRDDVAVTVLDLPVVGRDRDDVWARVERLRGRTAAATFAPRTHAGTVEQHRERYARPPRPRGEHRRSSGSRGLAGPDEVRDLARPQPVSGRYFSSVLESPSTRRATISCWICWVPSKMSRILESRAHFSSSSPSL